MAIIAQMPILRGKDRNENVILKFIRKRWHDEDVNVEKEWCAILESHDVKRVEVWSLAISEIKMGLYIRNVMTGKIDVLMMATCGHPTKQLERREKFDEEKLSWCIENSMNDRELSKIIYHALLAVDETSSMVAFVESSILKAENGSEAEQKVKSAL